MENKDQELAGPQGLFSSDILGYYPHPTTYPRLLSMSGLVLTLHPALSAPAGKHPKRSADWSGPKIFVSILDSSSLEDATDNFSFQEDPQDLCPVQHVRKLRTTTELAIYCVIAWPTFVLDAVGDTRGKWRWRLMRSRRRGRRGAGPEVRGREGRGGGAGGGEEETASQTSGQGQGSPSLAISYL